MRADAGPGPIRVKAKRRASAAKPKRVYVVRTGGDAGTDKHTVTARESEPIVAKGKVVGHRKVVHTFKNSSEYEAHRQRVKQGENIRAGMLADLSERSVYEKRTGKRDFPDPKDPEHKLHGDTKAKITTADRARVRKRARKLVRAQRAKDDKLIAKTGSFRQPKTPEPVDALRSLSSTLHDAKLEPTKGRHGIGGLLHNAIDEARDTVAGAPGTALELGKTARAAGRQLQRKVGLGKLAQSSMDIPGETSEADDAKRVHELKASVQSQDPIYALGEAAVKTVKGDSKGARKALRRAGEKAYERPLSTAATVAGGAGTVDRIAGRLAAGSKAEHIAARARPDKVVRRSGDAKVDTRAELDAHRLLAHHDVVERQHAAKAGREPHTSKPTRRVRRKQSYSRGLVTRKLQMARENRKVAKGKDPLALTGRKARRANAKTFDQATRNVKAGGLAREERAHHAAGKSRKHSKGELKAAAHELVVGGSVRHGRVREDLDALIAAQRHHGGEHAADNIAVLEKLKADPSAFRDRKLVDAAKSDRARLNESEQRLHREGFFGDTSPDFVRRLQPYLHRGEIVDRGPKRGEGGADPSPLPPSPDKPKGEAVEHPAIAQRKARSAESRATEAGALREQAMEHREAQAHVADQLAKLGEQAREVPMVMERRYVTGRDGVRRSKQVRKPKDAAAHKRLAKIRQQTAALREQHKTLGDRAQDFERRADRLDGARPSHEPATKHEPSPQDLAAQARRDAARGRFDFEANAKGEADAAPAVETREGGRQGGRPAELSARPSAQARQAVRERAGMPDRGAGAQAAAGAATDTSAGRYVWASGPNKGKAVAEHELDDHGHAFIRGHVGDTEPVMDPRVPKAGHGYSADDVLGRRLGAGRVHDTHAERERRIGLIRMNKMLLDRFAHRDGEATHFTRQRAEQLAKRASGPGDKHVAVKTGESEDSYIVLPKVIADRWERQFAEPTRTGRAMRMVTRQFIRTVLPFSATWHIGNAADLFTRLALSLEAGDVGNAAGTIAALRKAMHELDPHLADELLEPLKGHMGSRATVRVPAFKDLTHDAKHEFVRDLGETISGIRRVVGVRHVANATAAVTDKAFDLGKGLEAQFVKFASGAAARQYARELGIAVADHIKLGEQLAHEFKADPAKMEEFQRRTLEIVGDYVTKSPAERTAINTLAPFLQWLKASNKFVFHTLPAKHPIKTALALWAANMTAQERAKVGLNYYYDDSQLQAYGFPKAHRGFLTGGIDLGHGIVIPTSPYTSGGQAAELLADPVKVARGAVLPMIARPLEKGVRYGPEVGAEHLAESLVPGVKQTRRGLEGGGIPNPRSTIVHPASSGGGSAAQTVSGILTAPSPTVDYDTLPKRPKAGHDGHRRPTADPQVTIVTGSGKQRRTVKVKRVIR